MVLLSGYDLVKANALKVFIVMIYSPVTLIIFMYNNQVNYYLGLIVAIGNVFGGYYASKYAVKWGAGFVRWVLIVVITLYTIDLFNIFF